MTSEKTLFVTDNNGRVIRLTMERRAHILKQPEMNNQFERIVETLQKPQLIVATDADDTVHVYHRFYELTPVTSKFLHVVVKVLSNDAFVLTAFYSRREKKGAVIWKA